MCCFTFRLKVLVTSLTGALSCSVLEEKAVGTIRTHAYANKAAGGDSEKLNERLSVLNEIPKHAEIIFGTKKT